MLKKIFITNFIITILYRLKICMWNSFYRKIPFFGIILFETTNKWNNIFVELHVHYLLKNNNYFEYIIIIKQTYLNKLKQ